MRVLYILYISHRNFNRPLGDRPALSHPELVSERGKVELSTCLSTKTSCGALTYNYIHPLPSSGKLNLTKVNI